MRRIPCLILAVFVAACSGDDDAALAVDAGTDGSGEVPAMCGGIGGLACEDGDFCDYRGHSCGAGDDLGSCQARPDGCDGAYAPVCGCNGLVYPNECEANAAGFDASEAAACEAPDDYVRCGYRFCPKADTCVQGGTEQDPEFTCVAP
jgi:hypothetical protein